MRVARDFARRPGTSLWSESEAAAAAKRLRFIQQQQTGQPVYSSDELAEIAKAIAAKLLLSPEQVSLVQHTNGLLTVTVGESTFTGTVDEVWRWADSLANDRKKDLAP